MEDAEDFVDNLYTEIIELGFDAPSVDLLVEMASCGEYLSVAEILQDLINEDHSDWAAEICKRIASRDGQAHPDYATVAIILGTIVQTAGEPIAAKLVRKLTTPKKQQGAYTYDFVAAIISRMVAMRQTHWAAQLFWALMQDCGSSPHQDLAPKVLQHMAAADKAQHAADLCAAIIRSDSSEECRAYYDIGWALARMTELGQGQAAAAICSRMVAGSGALSVTSVLEGVASATDAETVASFSKLLQLEQQQGASAAAAALEGLAIKQ